MKELHELKSKLMEELKKQAKDISKKPSLSAGDLDTVNKLVKSIDRLCQIVESESGGYSEAYSRDGTWRASMEGDYGNGSSYSNYSNRGQHYVRGHYSRDGYSGNYSMNGDNVGMMEDMMRNARSSEEREAIRRCIDLMKG